MFYKLTKPEKRQFCYHLLSVDKLFPDPDEVVEEVDEEEEDEVTADQGLAPVAEEEAVANEMAPK